MNEHEIRIGIAQAHEYELLLEKELRSLNPKSKALKYYPSVWKAIYSYEKAIRRIKKSRERINKHKEEVERMNKCENCGKEVKEPFTICDKCAKKEYERKGVR